MLGGKYKYSLMHVLIGGKGRGIPSLETAQKQGAQGYTVPKVASAPHIAAKRSYQGLGFELRQMGEATQTQGPSKDRSLSLRNMGENQI